ncbi:hypothetical protein BKA14_002866 [Actinoplanes abujensis]|uniref:Uncharacterized protein n=1 Tax=Paractinoplanes abujensis TaxID=882441 RepID=A0A7W7CSY4_9ACTN|nr:hypothetical protein [Actinoplanes abujensis]
MLGSAADRDQQFVHHELVPSRVGISSAAGISA